MRTLIISLPSVLLTFLSMSLIAFGNTEIHLAQGLMSGEATESSVILQSRLTNTSKLVHGDIPGAPGKACFEYSTTEDFEASLRTSWLTAADDTDCIVKTKITGLTPNTRYYYRLLYRQDADAVQKSPTASFTTLGGCESKREISFVVVTGMNYVAFHYGRLNDGKRTGEGAYRGADAHLGFPALETIRRMQPDFLCGTGDNVYYDSRDAMDARTLKDMRRKWHEQFSQPRFIELFRSVPTYWEKDDHDHRYNDCDRTGSRPPSSDMGIRVFREQVPVVDPDAAADKTFRTHRVSRHLQIWLVEGRDYRSPNAMEDGPDKTLWGAEQLNWLKNSLLSSNATHKILISPTPMVGPDDAYKIDNHTNHRGFRREGREFFQWIKQRKLDQQGFAVICGDRHWQYHSVDPSGVEEFSSGAICDANSRLGRKPGDPESTDPDANIQQPYTQTEASGGFLRVVVGADGRAQFQFYDESGKLLYQADRLPHNALSVLDKNAPELLANHLLRRINQQYEDRRAAVAQALASRDLLKRRQQRLRASLKRIVGKLPDEKTPLNPQTTGVIKADGYRIEKVAYQSRPHHYVTANLYVPTRGNPPFPGVLVACGHSSLGKSYEPYQRIGALLAVNGIVALVYDPMGQGERRSFFVDSENAGLQHKLVNVNSMLVGRTAVGYQAWDGIRSVDYLLSRSEVDRTRSIGMTGNSGGGGQTMYLMALDDRIGPAAPSCHITTLERNFELGSAGDGCQSAPWTGAEGIDHPDFFAMRAPRPSIILAAEQDFKDIQFTRKTYREARSVYKLLNAPERVDLFVHNDKHSFSRPRREAATRWMRLWFFNDPSPVLEPDLKLQAAEALQVTRTGQVLREFPDAEAIDEWNLRRARHLAADRAAFWNTSTMEDALAEVRRMIGVRHIVEPPQVESRGLVQRDHYEIEKLVIRRVNEMPIPALLFRPRGVRSARPGTLFVDGRGKAANLQLIESRVKAGHLVLSVDLRGFGETADPRNEIIYSQGDHRVAMWSLHLGQSLLGQRVEELLASFSYLLDSSEVDNRQVHLIGYGRAGPVALHAARFNPAFVSVTLLNSIRSWVDDVVARPTDMHSISHVVPSALTKYDLTDLARGLKHKLRYDD